MTMNQPNPTHQPIYRFEDPEGFRFAAPGERPSRFRYRDGDRAFFEGRKVSGPVVILPERGKGKALFIPSDPREGGFLAYPWPTNREGQRGREFFPHRESLNWFDTAGAQLGEEIANEAIHRTQEAGEAIDWAPLLPGRYISPILERIGREIYNGRAEAYRAKARETPNPEIAMKHIYGAFEASLTGTYCRALGRK